MALANWYRRAFVHGEYPLIQLMDTPQWRKNTVREAKFAKKVLAVRHGDEVLDVCCGAGRHSLAFEKLGLHATGVDLSPVYLREAKKRARRLKVSPEWIKGDVRKLKIRERFDGAVNLFTSFGYFLKQEDDNSFLAAIAKSLKRKARFLLDTVNAERILEQGPQDLWEKLPDGTLMLKATRLTQNKKAILTEWTILAARGKTHRYTAFTRLYTRKLLGKSLERCGFKLIRFYGAMADESFDPDSSRRLVVLCERR
jgi:ubiquinone/menaquinone biosynthesis C-methylase UbiE